MATSQPPAGVVFNPEEALRQCFDNADMLRKMIQCFFDDVENLLPQMRVALEQGQLKEVGRLGHRMKGTVVYLAARPAKEAAEQVEQLCTADESTGVEAQEAVDALERECMALKTVLAARSGK